MGTRENYSDFTERKLKIVTTQRKVKVRLNIVYNDCKGAARSWKRKHLQLEARNMSVRRRRIKQTKKTRSVRS